MENQESSSGEHEAAVGMLHATEASLVPFVCPLYDFDRFEIPSLLGSSVLLQVGSLHILVTAAHVLQDASSSLFIAGPTFDLEQLKYGRQIVETNWDFAVLELHEESVMAMSNFSFWQVEASDPNDGVARSSVYAFIGFPKSRNKTKVPSKFIQRGAFAYSGSPVKPSVYREMKMREQGVLLVNFDRNKVVGAKRKIETAPDLYGISGGGVWRIDRMGALSREGASLVGICVRQHPREKVLEAVRIGLVFEALREIYPAHAETIPMAQRFSANVEIQEEPEAPLPEPQENS